MENNRPSLRMFCFISICLLFGSLAVLLVYQRSTALTLSDRAETHEIAEALRRFDEVYVQARQAEDVSLLNQILVDDDLYLLEIGNERAQELREYIALVSGAEQAKHIGYLTAMQNKLTHRLHGAHLLREEMAKATAEGRAWTAEDLEALAERNFGQIPGLPNEGLIDPWIITPDKILKLEIDGDRARVVYDGGMRTQTALLVRKDGQWLIAGIL